MCITVGAWFTIVVKNTVTVSVFICVPVDVNSMGSGSLFVNVLQFRKTFKELFPVINSVVLFTRQRIVSLTKNVKSVEL